MAMPGRAQQAPGGRFAFADTTLMRDTLGLSFEGLFPIADSLGLTPDTLRALSIRYRYTLPRLLKLSDSLGVVVDSVGSVMLRERFNPLVTGTRRQPVAFTYRSTYEIEQYSTAWTNGSEFFVPAGKVRISGNTSSRFDRREQGGRTNLDMTRGMSTRADWVFSQNLSAGGVLDLSRTDNRARGSINNFKIDDSRFSLSVLNRHRPRPGMTSELSLSSGLVDYSGADKEQRGISGGVNGKVRNTSRWVTHDASGGVSGNFARTRLPGAEQYSRTTDFSDNLRGTLGVLSTAPIGLNLNYNLRDSKVETPADSGKIQQVLTGSQGMDMTLRMRRDNDRYVTVGGRVGNSQTANATYVTSQNSRRDRGLTVSGRYRIREWALDGSFGRALGTTKYPRLTPSGGYAEDRDSRSVDGTLQWNLSTRFTARANGSVRLERYRYFILGSYSSTKVPRDQYDQSYKVEGKYTYSQRFNTGLVLEVGRSLYVNIPAASTAANTETRRYRSSWDWTFHLLPGLTATQNNSLNASYVYYTFLPASADRLVLDYFTHTSVNTDVTPRLHIDVYNDFRYQPTGGYAPLDPPLDDGNSYFSQADENYLSILGASMTYSLGSALSLSVIPTYTATDRNGISDGEAVKQNATRTLNLSGAANLNFPIGRKGQLTGSVSRNFNANRRITYSFGEPDNQPAAEYDFWSGRLQLSWDL